MSFLKQISIPLTKHKYSYIFLNNEGQIKLIHNSYNNYHIEYLIDNKFYINKCIFEIINNKLSLYYQGELNNEYLFHGEGTLYHNNIYIMYKGLFENGILKSGDNYMGDVFPQYIIYSGTFTNYIPNGTGIYYNKQGIKIYEGMINMDKKTGNGISYWDTTGLKNWDGQWLNNLKHGIGYLYDENETLICHCQCDHDNIINIF